MGNQLTFTTSQQPHDIKHPVPSFADTAAAASFVAVDTGGGGVSGGEGMVVVMGGAGIPGFSTTSSRLASCQMISTASQVMYATQRVIVSRQLPPFSIENLGVAWARD